MLAIRIAPFVICNDDVKQSVPVVITPSNTESRPGVAHACVRGDVAECAVAVVVIERVGRAIVVADVQVQVPVVVVVRPRRAEPGARIIDASERANLCKSAVAVVAIKFIRRVVVAHKDIQIPVSIKVAESCAVCVSISEGARKCPVRVLDRVRIRRKGAVAIVVKERVCVIVHVEHEQIVVRITVYIAPRRTDSGFVRSCVLVFERRGTLNATDTGEFRDIDRSWHIAGGPVIIDAGHDHVKNGSVEKQISGTDVSVIGVRIVDEESARNEQIQHPIIVKIWRTNGTSGVWQSRRVRASA